MSAFWPYQQCYSCSGRAQSGTVDLLKYVMLRFPGVGSLGIYNCRPSSGGGGLSIHACGRAIDFKIPTLAGGAANNALGDPVVALLSEFAYEIGNHGMIWDRVRYDSRSPRGREYTGPHPHYDHIHFEQRLEKATTLTLADYVRIMGSVTAPPASGGGSTLLPINKESSSEDVKLLQDHLNYQVVAGETPLDVDGIYGPGTVAMVKKKVGSLGVTAAQIAGTEVGYRQWNHIEAVFMINQLKDDWLSSIAAHAKVATAHHPLEAGGVTAAQVDQKIASHAATKASAAVHPHTHAEGTTGPAQ